MIWFVGAGPGAEDLITVRGQRLLMEADLVIYAGSLVNPELLKCCKESCEIRNSAFMTLEQVIDAMVQAEEDGKKIVRLHTGDPSLYGAIREQMDLLDEKQITYQVCPGVSSFSGAAAGRIYPARRIPVGGYHQNGGTYTGSGEGICEKLCRTWSNHGAVFKYRIDRKAYGRITCRRIYGRYPGSDRI